MTKIGLVTVLYRSRNVLPGFLESLRSQTGVQLHLIVVSNDQDEESLDMCCNASGNGGLHIEIIRNSDNVGIAKANNQGIKRLLTLGIEFICILNNDIEFQNDTIGRLVTSLEQGYDAVSPRIDYYDTPGRPWYEGGQLSYFLARTEHRHLIPSKETFGAVPTGFASGCFLLCRASIFETVGLFFEPFFVYYEDSDFIARFLRQGFRLGFDPAVRVLHKVSSSTGGATSEFSIYYLNRNRLLFIRRNCKGPARPVATIYYLLTRAIRMSTASRATRRIMLRAMRDGYIAPKI